jgi:hypothetical protein
MSESSFRSYAAAAARGYLASEPDRDRMTPLSPTRVRSFHGHGGEAPGAPKKVPIIPPQLSPEDILPCIPSTNRHCAKAAESTALRKGRRECRESSRLQIQP